MKIKLQLLMLLFTVVSFQVSAATITWDGGAGTTNWLDAMNWSTDAIPTALDDVDLAGSTVVLGANTTVQRVYAGGSSDLTISAGVVLTITGFTGGDDGLEVQNSATVTNNGTIVISNISGASADGLYVKGTFINAATGTITITTTDEYGIYVQGGTFTNNGIITITNYGQSNGDRDGIAVDDNSGVGGTFTNSAGTITITMTGGDDGIYVNDASTFNNDALLIVGGTSGDNGLRVDDGAVFNNNSGGTFTINSTPDDQLFLDNDGAFNNSGTVSLNNGADVGLYVTDDGLFTNMTGGTVSISGGSNYSIQIDANNNTAEIVNNGIITTTGGKDGLRLQEDGVFTNNSTGTLYINAPNEDGINFQSSGGTFTNNGLVDIFDAPKEGVDMSAGTFTNSTGATFIAIDCLQDNIEINNSSVFTNDGIVDVARTGADASGRDDIEVNTGATFTNTANATYSPGDTIGEMEVRGDVNFGNSTITFEINGTSNTTDYDRIELVSTSTIVTVTNATAHLDWGNYLPAVNDEFEIINGSTGSMVNGGFSIVTTSNSIIQTSQIDTDTSVIIKVTGLLICDDVTNLAASNITSTSADFNWGSSASAASYGWLVVPAGAAPIAANIIDGGVVTDTFATTAVLSAVTSYDLYVQADCGTGIGLSNTVGPFTFTTTCPGGLSATVTHTITAVTCNSGSDGSIDVMVTGGVSPFTYAWDNGDSTAVISGLIAGTYIVTITDGNGCPGSETYTVSEPDALVISVSAISDTSGAGVGSATATVTGGTAPYTYEWDGTAGTDMLTGLTMGTYLLSVTDDNGCSDTVSVSIDDATSTNALDYLNNLSIHPNPTQGNLMINIELAKAANVGITVHTITGLLIADLGNESTTQQTQTLDLSNYAEGMYFVRFVIDNHVITKKVILMK